MDQEIINIGEFLQARYFAEDDVPRSGCIHPEFSHTMMICVDSFQKGLARGRIHTYFFAKETAFQSLDQMLFGIEEILDLAGETQRDTQLHTGFEKKRKKDLDAMSDEQFFAHVETGRKSQKPPFYTPGNINVKPGAVASYYIRVIARQHSSMQGVINRWDKGGTATFRSEMELLRLIRDDLAAERSWAKQGAGK